MLCSRRSAETLYNHPAIRPVLNKKSRELSGGELRFIEVMSMIYSSAEFVLIDEPFSGMSPIMIEEVKAHFKTAAADKGFIVTDHSYGNILDIATRTILIQDGATKYVQKHDDLKRWGYIP